MNKREFLLELTEKLSPLPREEIAERWDYYSEMIDDRMEEGLTEEEAVASLGTVDEIAAQIAADIPLMKFVKGKVKPTRRWTALEIVLLILGFPIWFSLAAAVFAVILSLYVSIWAIIISLWAAFGAVAASGAGVIIGGIVFVLRGDISAGFAALAAGLVCGGVSIFLFFGCKAVTKGVSLLTGKGAQRLKKCFMKKEKAE